MGSATIHSVIFGSRDTARQQKGLPSINSQGRLSNLYKQEGLIWLACGRRAGPVTLKEKGRALPMGKYRKLAENSWERVLVGGENVVFSGRE